MQTQAPAYRSPDVVRFLRVLMRKIRDKLLVIWDGSPIHRGQPIKDFLRKGAAKRLHLEQLLGYAPDLNPDEGIWNYLKRVESGNCCCPDLPALALALRQGAPAPQARSHPGLYRTGGLPCLAFHANVSRSSLQRAHIPDQCIRCAQQQKPCPIGRPAQRPISLTVARGQIKRHLSRVPLVEANEPARIVAGTGWIAWLGRVCGDTWTLCTDEDAVGGGHRKQAPVGTPGDGCPGIPVALSASRAHGNIEQRLMQRGVSHGNHEHIGSNEFRKVSRGQWWSPIRLKTSVEI
jgi:transposase